VVAGLSLLTAACGAATPRAGVARLGASTAPAPGALLHGGELVEYASCMRSHGVLSFPDPASFDSSAAI
jgi:hypothetical protein